MYIYIYIYIYVYVGSKIDVKKPNNKAKWLMHLLCSHVIPSSGIRKETGY